MKTLAKWSVSDYHRMIKAGILRDRRVELLAGEIIEMSLDPIRYSTAKRNTKYLEELLVGRADIRFNGPITLLRISGGSTSYPDANRQICSRKGVR